MLMSANPGSFADVSPLKGILCDNALLTWNLHRNRDQRPNNSFILKKMTNKVGGRGLLYKGTPARPQDGAHREWADADSLIGDRKRFGGPVGDGGFIQGDFLSTGRIAQDAGDYGSVHSVPGAVGLDVAENPLAKQRQVAYQVQHLVADELVSEAQRGVVNAIAGKHDTVLPRSATDEAHVEHLTLLMKKTEGARGSDLVHVAAVR